MRNIVAVLFINETDVFIGHIGDSGVYTFDKCGLKKYHGSQLFLITDFVQKIKEEIRRHPDRNIILRAMGTE